MIEDIKCNILIMGKTGTGKSTLLNYLCGTNIAQTGTGKPVTGDDIYEYPAFINGRKVNIYDSWGLEAGKTEEWKNLLQKKLKEHGVQKDWSDWFHSVIYCIQAGGNRVEDIDTEIIRQFLKDGYILTVVLTKADQVDENDEKKMRSAILEGVKDFIPIGKKINIIATCAEKKKTRMGETNPFGKEEVINSIFEGFKESIINKVPDHIIANLHEEVDKWEKKEISKARSWCEDYSYDRLVDMVEKDVKDLNIDAKKDKMLEDVLKQIKGTHEALKDAFKAHSIPSLFRLLFSSFHFDVSIMDRLKMFFSKSVRRDTITKYIQEKSESLKRSCDYMKHDIKTQLLRSM